MRRAVWKGAISFSLIHIPVEMVPATKAHGLDFDLLDRTDFSPVGYQRFNKKTGRTLPWEQIVKGYEYEPGNYVVMTDEDFRQANVQATETIDIQGFVEREAVPPYYFDTPYYLRAGKGGEKVYALLHRALEKSRMLGLASIVMRARQHICALLPVERRLLLNTLRFVDEMVPPDDEPTENKPGAVSGREFSMAVRLIEEMKTDFDPTQFKDSYREDLLRRIEDKVKHGQTKQLTEAEKPARARASAKVIDLTALLKNSLTQQQRNAPRSLPAARHAGTAQGLPARKRKRSG